MKRIYVITCLVLMVTMLYGCGTTSTSILDVPGYHFELPCNIVDKSSIEAIIAAYGEPAKRSVLDSDGTIILEYKYLDKNKILRKDLELYIKDNELNKFSYQFRI